MRQKAAFGGLYALHLTPTWLSNHVHRLGSVLGCFAKWKGCRTNGVVIGYGLTIHVRGTIDGDKSISFCNLA